MIHLNKKRKNDTAYQHKLILRQWLKSCKIQWYSNKAETQILQVVVQNDADEIDIDELLKALATSKNNKAPGTVQTHTV